MTELLVALRGVVRRPTLSMSIIATLGLAIGANVAVFSMLYAIPLRPLPFPDADLAGHRRRRDRWRTRQAVGAPAARAGQGHRLAG